MNIRFTAVISTFAVFLVCSTSSIAGCRDYYGSGTNCGYSSGSIPFSNASILGVGGSVLGGALYKSNPAAGAILAGVPLYYLGRNIDQREDYSRAQRIAEAEAVGYTDCGYSAQKTGIDPNGAFRQSAQSGKRIVGYKQSCN